MSAYSCSGPFQEVKRLKLLSGTTAHFDSELFDSANHGPEETPVVEAILASKETRGSYLSHTLRGSVYRQSNRYEISEMQRSS
jgi:hypothetical protein